MFFDRPEAGTKAMLLSLRFDGSNSYHNLAELEELARSAGYEVSVAQAISRKKPDPRTGLGRGKVHELREELDRLDLRLLILDCELTASQQNNLEAALKRRVLTRTELILTIFEDRAQTREGKLQVELALLRHAQTHIVGGWSHLDRQRGGVNMRGAGELQSSIDKGLIQRRIHLIEKRLDKVSRQRAQHRRQRTRAEVATVAIVGYTNAGKSTLFNALTEAQVYADDRLFATLDPTMRRLELPNGETILLADTVGFIRDLPLSLVAAFKATLEEVTQADLLIHVVDASAPDAELMMENVEEILAEIGAERNAVIHVFNKIDQSMCEGLACRPGVRVSATRRLGFDELLSQLVDHFKRETTLFDVTLPPSAGKLRAWLHSLGTVREEAYEVDGSATMKVELSEDRVTHLKASPGVSLQAIDIST